VKVVKSLFLNTGIREALINNKDVIGTSLLGFYLLRTSLGSKNITYFNADSETTSRIDKMFNNRFEKERRVEEKDTDSILQTSISKNQLKQDIPVLNMTRKQNSESLPRILSNYGSLMEKTFYEKPPKAGKISITEWR
jgi:hypothetical protein